MHGLINNTLGGAASGLASHARTLIADMGFWEWAWFGSRAASADARGTDDMFMFLFWLSTFWFVLLMGLMFWFCVKWRRKPGVPAPISPSHNTPLEIFWTIVPTILLVIIFFRGFWDYVERVVARGDSIMMTVQAQKWNWEMTYANGRTTTQTTSLGGRIDEVKIFYVPEDSGIQLRMSSSDVIHSFWVPDWRIKCDIFPNRYTSIWFETEKLVKGEPGVLVHPDRDPTTTGLPHEEEYIYRDHIIYCAEYCGDFHSEMIGIIRVVPRDVYVSWVNDPGIDWDGTPLWQVGQILYRTKGCSSCHTVNGARSTGPTWLNAWGSMVPLTNGQQVRFDENYFRTSVYVPAAQIHQGYANQMTVFTPDQINERELGALMAYMMHLAGIEMDPLAAQSIIDGGPATATPPEGEGEPAP